MELFLVPNNPEHTVLVSPNGVAHYQVKTAKARPFGGPYISRIRRPADSEETSVVAEIEWKKWGTSTVVHSNLLTEEADGLKAKDFLYKRGQFSSYVGSTSAEDCLTTSPYSSRYFIGNDNCEYRWKADKRLLDFVVSEYPRDVYKAHSGSSLFQLTRSGTDEEVARYVRGIIQEGMFAGERRSYLRVQPCSVDIDLVVISFMIMEMKRRNQAGDGTMLIAHDEDPQGDGGAGEGGGG
jgi:hypothetical protein